MRSTVLDEIHEIAHAEEGGGLGEAEYRLGLSYGVWRCAGLR